MLIRPTRGLDSKTRNQSTAVPSSGGGQTAKVAMCTGTNSATIAAAIPPVTHTPFQEDSVTVTSAVDSCTLRANEAAGGRMSALQVVPGGHRRAATGFRA